MTRQWKPELRRWRNRREPVVLHLEKASEREGIRCAYETARRLLRPVWVTYHNGGFICTDPDDTGDLAPDA